MCLWCSASPFPHTQQFTLLSLWRCGTRTPSSVRAPLTPSSGGYQRPKSTETYAERAPTTTTTCAAISKHQKQTALALAGCVLGHKHLKCSPATHDTINIIICEVCKDTTTTTCPYTIHTQNTRGRYMWRTPQTCICKIVNDYSGSRETGLFCHIIIVVVRFAAVIYILYVRELFMRWQNI